MVSSLKGLLTYANDKSLIGSAARITRERVLLHHKDMSKECPDIKITEASIVNTISKLQETRTEMPRKPTLDKSVSVSSTNLRTKETYLNYMNKTGRRKSDADMQPPKPTEATEVPPPVEVMLRERPQEIKEEQQKATYHDQLFECAKAIVRSTKKMVRQQSIRLFVIVYKPVSSLRTTVSNQ